MLDLDRLRVIRFDAKELIEITTQRNFSYSRAQQWILNHEAFSLQIIILYLMTIFFLKQFMNNRPPFSLDWSIRSWNLLIALLSGFCAVGMTKEFFNTLLEKGITVSLCSSSDTFFHGSNGFYLWCYHIIRLFEFIDTLFIILRKQPLLFIHWYHHALTLFVSWFTYARPSSSSRFGIYANACIHTVMYIYFFLRASKIRLPLFVARTITTAQIIQFVIALWAVAHPTLLKYGLGKPCELEDSFLFWTWFMVLCYLYLFIDFYSNKYNKTMEGHERKTEKKFE